METREIVLDTEATGLDAESGDRIIEIGCVELIGYVATGQCFHKFVDPEREIPISATRIHGITTEMVRGMQKFAEIAEEFLDFIKDSTLIIHNAQFDLRFIASELKLIGRTALDNPVVDTLEVARRKFPGMPASLDALCKRFNISTQDRKFHGALKDAVLLSRVYIELSGGLQKSLDLDTKPQVLQDKHKAAALPQIVSRTFEVSDSERKLHRESISKIKNPIWNMYFKKNDQGVE